MIKNRGDSVEENMAKKIFSGKKKLNTGRSGSDLVALNIHILRKLTLLSERERSNSVTAT